jgi:topoisomerase-4 subunit A
MIDLEPGTQAAHFVAGSAERTLLLANTGGFGLLARIGDLTGRQRAGKGFLSLEPGEHLLPAVAVEADHSQVACLAMSGRLLLFGLGELKLQASGGRGLTLMDVDAKDPLRVVGTGRGGKPRDEELRGSALLAHLGKRARKGRKVAGSIKPTRVVAI